MYIDIDENGSLSTSRPCHTASSTFLASSSLPLSFFPPFRCGMMVLVVLEGHSRTCWRMSLWRLCLSKLITAKHFQGGIPHTPPPHCHIHPSLSDTAKGFMVGGGYSRMFGCGQFR